MAGRLQPRRLRRRRRATSRRPGFWWIILGAAAFRVVHADGSRGGICRPSRPLSGHLVNMPRGALEEGSRGHCGVSFPGEGCRACEPGCDGDRGEGEGFEERRLRRSADAGQDAWPSGTGGCGFTAPEEAGSSACPGHRGELGGSAVPLSRGGQEGQQGTQDDPARLKAAH